MSLGNMVSVVGSCHHEQWSQWLVSLKVNANNLKISAHNLCHWENLDVLSLQWNVGLLTADVTFNFSMAYRSPVLFGNHYSEYQLFLCQLITEHGEQGMTVEVLLSGWAKNDIWPCGSNISELLAFIQSLKRDWQRQSFSAESIYQSGQT